MWFKWLVIAFMLFILYSLGSGLYYLMTDSGKTQRTVRALTWRIGLSLLLFILLMLAYFLGLVQPNVM